MSNDAPSLERCAIPACERWCQPGRALCEGHRRKKKLGLPLDVPLRPRKQAPWTLLTEAALHFAEAANDDAVAAAAARLRVAALRYVRAKKRGSGHRKRRAEHASEQSTQSS